MNTRKKLQIDFDEKESSPLSQVQVEDDVQSDDSNFPFSKTISNLLYVYGDQKKSEANNLAHLIIQELISALFDIKSLKALLLPSPNPWNEEEQEQTLLKMPAPNSKIKKIIQSYLYAVFQEFVLPYQKLSKNLSKVEKSVSQNEDIYEKALLKKSQQENIVLQDEVYSQSESAIPCEQGESPQIHWENYMKNRVENMTRREFIKFMELRSKTFINHKQFKKLIDPFDYGTNFIDSLNLKFLNYCLCKVLKKIIQKAMKQCSVSPFKLDEDTLKKYGYEIIQVYIIRSKKYALQDQKLQAMAYKLFLKEFISQGYDAYFQLKLKLTKDGIKNIDNQLRAQDEWNKMGIYRQRWIERIKAEKQIRQKYLKNKLITPNNSYTSYLIKSIENCTFEESKDRFPIIFKSWFLNYNINSKPIESIYD